MCVQHGTVILQSVDGATSEELHNFIRGCIEKRAQFIDVSHNYQLANITFLTEMLDNFVMSIPIRQDVVTLSAAI